MTPSAPSEPQKSRSGAGPAPPAGSRRVSSIPAGRHDRQSFDLLVDVRGTGGVVAAGARGDPAAERRELERLRKVAEGEAVRLQLLLERGSEHSRLDLRRARALVDVEHAAEPPQVEADGSLRSRRRRPARRRRRPRSRRRRGRPRSRCRCTSRGSPPRPLPTRAARRGREAPGTRAGAPGRDRGTTCRRHGPRARAGRPCRAARAPRARRSVAAAARAPPPAAARPGRGPARRAALRAAPRAREARPRRGRCLRIPSPRTSAWARPAS